MIRRMIPAIAAICLLPALTAASALGRGEATTATLVGAARSAPSADATVAGPPAASAARPVVEGTITYKGKAVKDAVLIFYAEPPSSVLKKVKHGKDAPFKVIGSATTNKHGGYSITVTGAGLKLARAYSFGKNHVVNLQIQAIYKTLGGMFWFSRQIVLGSLGDSAVMQAFPASSPAKATAPQVANLKLSKPPTGKGESAAEAAAAGRASDQAWLRLSAEDSPSLPLPNCVTILEPVVDTSEQPGPQWTTVGATYSNMKDVYTSFVYGNGQESSLGVAMSIDPPQGFTKWGPLGLDFGVGGSVTTTSYSNVPFSTFKGQDNHDYQTRFTYGVFFNECRGFFVQPIAFDSGSRSPSEIGFAGSNQHCAPFEPSQKTFYQTTGVAYTYTAGVNISYWVGIDLSSTTGYDTSAELTYWLPKGGYLCGTTGDPGTAANGNLLYAGKYGVAPGSKGR
jgi:hypothetical protein